MINIEIICNLLPICYHDATDPEPGVGKNSKAPQTNGIREPESFVSSQPIRCCLFGLTA